MKKLCTKLTLKSRQLVCPSLITPLKELEDEIREIRSPKNEVAKEENKQRRRLSTFKH
jgi:hypothetical protein